MQLIMVIVINFNDVDFFNIFDNAALNFTLIYVSAGVSTFQYSLAFFLWYTLAFFSILSLQYSLAFLVLSVSRLFSILNFLAF